MVRAADQIELVDMTPEALRRRMAHGNIYAAEKVDAALGNYFRVGNLGALRELALLWVADRVDDALQDYMDAHGIDDTWETRERVVVAVTGAPSGEQLIRRAARMAQPGAGASCSASTSAPATGWPTAHGSCSNEHRAAARDLGGDVPRGRRATTSPRALDRLRPGRERHPARAGRQPAHPLGRAVRGLGHQRRRPRSSGPIDVHVISADADEAAGRPHGRAAPPTAPALAVSRRRQRLGLGARRWSGSRC